MEQRVLYRQQSSERIDFPALGQALQSIKLGTVDLKRLAQKHGDTDFLTDLKKSGRKVDSIAVVNENTDYGSSVSASVLDAAKTANIAVAAHIAYNAVVLGV